MNIAFRDAKYFLLPLATMLGTIIGIGIFGLPYVAVKAGLPLMFLYFVVLGSLVGVVHLMFCELSLNTPDYKRLPGFCRIYLGEWARSLAVVSNIIGFFGILVAFMIVGGEFLYEFAGPLFQGPAVLYNYAYFFAGAILIFFGINIVSRVGFLGLAMFFIIFIALALKGMPFFELSNLTTHIGGAGDIFLPYGAVLFSLWASSSIPEVEEMLGRKEKKYLLKPVVMTASIIALVTYVLFIIMIVGITGEKTATSALVGLKDAIGGSAASLFFLFGLIISFNSFIIVGLTLKKILSYDLRIEKHAAWGLVAIVPPILFMAGFKNFIDIFNLVGGVLLGIDGLLILMMYKKLKPDRALLIYPLAAIFIGGMAYEIIYYLL